MTKIKYYSFKNMKMVTYEAIFDEDNVKGVFGISLVENPATKEMFIQLSADEQKEIKEKEIKLSTINEEQRLLVGLVLEPNSPVYRNQNGEEFNIIFSQDTITQLAHNFFKSDFHKNSTIEHDSKDKISGVTFVESWIVADPKKDKSNVYGLEYPEGSWLVAMKVDSDEVWNDYVKTGKVKGFSIDAVVKLKRIDNKSKLSMSAILDKLTEVSNQLAVALKLKEAPEKETPEKEAEIKLGQVNMEGGEIIFEYEGETLEVGANVFAISKENTEEKIPVPVGKYPLEDGSILVVTVEGVVGEITPKEAPEEVPAEKVEEKEEPATEKSVVNDIKSILIKYQEESNLRFEAIEKQLLEMKESVVEMSEQPNAKPKVGMATTVVKKTNYQILKENEANNKR